MGDGKLGAVPGMTARSIDREVNALMLRLDSFLCAASTQKRDYSTNQLLNEDLRKEEGNLTVRTSAFVDACTDYIVDKASKSISRGEAEDIKCNLKNLDPFIATELLLAINYTKDISAITSREFIDNLGQLDKYVASALLYEIRLTGNEIALTDARIFENGAQRFFNKLGSEAASEWFNSIGRTGNVAALISETALSDGVLNAVKGNASLASELSYAIGTTGKTKMLTRTEFLKVLNGMDSTIAAEYLSAIWCTKRVDELTNTDIMVKIASGATDVWKDAVRMFNGDNQNATKVLISKAEDDAHDRGVKLIIQSLINSGFDVIYAANVQSHEELVNIALEEKVHAIGFSVTGDGAQGMITGAIANAKIRGLNDISFFAGGMINPQLARILECRGATLFMPGSSQGELLNFLNSSISSKVGQGGFGASGGMQMYQSRSGPIQSSSIGGGGDAAFSTTILAKPYTFLMELIMRLNGAQTVPFWLTNPALYPAPNMGPRQQAVFNSTMKSASGIIASSIMARDELVHGSALPVVVQNAPAAVKAASNGADSSMPFRISIADAASGAIPNYYSEGSLLSGTIHPKVGWAIQSASSPQVESPQIPAGQYSGNGGFWAAISAALQKPASSISIYANVPQEGILAEPFAERLQSKQTTPNTAIPNALQISSNQIQFISTVFDGKNKNGITAINQNLLQEEISIAISMAVQKSRGPLSILKNATDGKDQTDSPVLGTYPQQIPAITTLAEFWPTTQVKIEMIKFHSSPTAYAGSQNTATKLQEPKTRAVDADAKIQAGQVTFFLDLISIFSAFKTDRSPTERIILSESAVPTTVIQNASSEYSAIKVHKAHVSKSAHLEIPSLTIAEVSSIPKSKARNVKPSNITATEMAMSILLSNMESPAVWRQAALEEVATTGRLIRADTTAASVKSVQTTQNASGERTVMLSLISSPAKETCRHARIADISNAGLFRKSPESSSKSVLSANAKATNGTNPAQKINDCSEIEVKKQIAFQIICQDESWRGRPAGISSSCRYPEGAPKMAIARAGNYQDDGIGLLRKIIKTIANGMRRFILSVA